MWRGLVDSRLELAGLVGGVPWNLFNPPQDGEFEGAIDLIPDTALPTSGMPTCSGVPSDPGSERYRDLIGGLRVDFRDPASDIVASVREELFESFPTAFEEVDATSMSDEEFVLQLGLEPSGLRAAADDMREMIAVQGRAIETDPNDPDLIVGADREEPPRSSFLVATTLGAGHFEEFDDAYPQHRPTLSYAVRGNANVKDYVGSAMDRALGGIPSLDPNAREVLGALRTQLREQQPFRGQLCVGEAAAGVPSSFRFRLYGVRTTIEKTEAEVEYELWLGERGLECALTGAVAGVPCEDGQWRIGAEPIVNTDGAESRLGATYVEWSVSTLADLPSRALEATPRVYLTGRGSAEERRRELSGFSLTAGDDDDEFSRCLTLPVGGSVLTDVEDVVATAGTFCSEPAMLCGDFPYDFKLPLEDELTEATTGRDDIESSFARFLRLARVAADEADRLGEQLIEQGLQLDQRAEEARDELETLCGPVVNVPDLLPDLTPTACTTVADCDGGLDCRDGVCVGSIADLVTLENDSDLQALQRCLGAGTTTSVNLGQFPSCIFRQNGGAPCECTSVDCPLEGDLPQCPQTVREDTSCDEIFPPELTSVPGVVVSRTRPLAIVSPPEDGGGGAPPNCLDLARLRQQAFEGDADTALRELLAQAWIYQEPARAASHLYGFQADMLGFSTMTLGFRRWASTGTYRSGPIEPTEFPCSSILPGTLFADLNCSGATPRYGKSIMCGMSADFGGACSSDPSTRVRMTQRMGRGLTSLAGLSGAFETSIRRGGARERGINVRRGDLFAGLPTWILDEASLLAGRPVSSAELGGLRLFENVNDREGIQCLDLQETPLVALLESRIIPVDELFASERDDIGMENPNWRCLFTSADRVASPFVRDEPETDGVAEPSGDIDRSAVWEPRFGDAVIVDDRTVSPEVGPGGVVRPSVSNVNVTAPTIYEVLNLVAHDSDSASRDAFYGGAQMPLVVEMLYRNPHRPAPAGGQDRMTYGDVLDGLELACLAQEQIVGGTGCGADIDELPRIDSPEDLVVLKQFIECAAEQVERLADDLVVVDVPEDIIEDIVSGSVSSTSADNRGLQGEVVPELIAAFNDIKGSIRQVVSAMRDFATQMDVVRGAIEVKDLEKIVNGLQTAIQVAQILNQCVGTNALSARCFGGSAIQAAAAVTASIFRMQIVDIERQTILASALLEFGNAADVLSNASRNLSSAVARVNQLVVRFERQKEGARRAAARALGLDRDDVGREYNVNRAMRARLNLTRQRYEAARTRAVRMAWIARRAIEQRVGMNLSTLEIDMPLVGRPAEWADRICSLQGVDYDDLRDPDTPTPEFADVFVGDYVTLLELFIDAYRFRFPFTDGDDTAVLSLRDDFVEVRAQCFVPAPNILTSTEDLVVAESEDEIGWARACDTFGQCGVVDPTEDSPFLVRASFPSDLLSPSGRQRAAGDSRSYTLQVAFPAEADEPPLIGEATIPGWAQTVTLPRGTYFATWYEQLPEPVVPSDAETMACAGSCSGECDGDLSCPCQAACEAQACSDILDAEMPPRVPLLAVEAIPTVSTAEIVTTTEPVFLSAATDPWVDACRWRRAFAEVTVPQDSTVRIAFGFALENLELFPGGVVWGAPMLESQPVDESGVLTFAPTGYVATDRNGLLSGLCSDDRGERFRTGFVWRSDCEQVCADGFGPTCESGDGRTVERCFHETTFSMSLDEIERGELIPSGSLAIGNFNYRHISLGMNVVGTGVFDCSESRTPDTCFSSGFVPFSLRHDGPYRVRNHRGEAFQSPLFVGNMEYGKALVAERFLTNPVSSADRTLMQDFVRGEFLGRPLDGQYTLRIWDAEGFDWEKVEDVQILLNYRYWTRFE